MPDLLWYQYFQWIALITAVLFYRHLTHHRMGFFLSLCLVVVLVEWLSHRVIEMGYPNNYFIINLYYVVSTPLYLLIFYRHLNLGPRYRIVFGIGAAIISLGIMGNYLLGEGIHALNTISIIIQQFINIIFSCALLFQSAIRDEYFKMTGDPLFWVAAGLLIFSLGSLVVMGMNQFIRINHLTISNKNLYRVIMPVLNVILYSAYTFAFILCRQKKKSYSPS